MAKHRYPIGMRVGVQDFLERGFPYYGDLGLDTVQLSYGDTAACTPENLAALKRMLQDVPLYTASVGWSEPCVWDLVEGPSTLGLGAEAYRERRLQNWLRAIDINAQLGIPLLQTHFGFVPEEPKHPLYAMYVESLRKLARHGAQRGVTFCLETGQETPIAMRRLLAGCGEPNVGANLDTANLLMYGKANPVDAVDVLGTWIKSLHIKDGDYPETDDGRLGKEYPVGQGRVDFPGVLARLKAQGFHGPLIIEREIRGPRQIADTREAVRLLEAWLEA